MTAVADVTALDVSAVGSKQIANGMPIALVDGPVEPINSRTRASLTTKLSNIAIAFAGKSQLMNTELGVVVVILKAAGAVTREILTLFIDGERLATVLWLYKPTVLLIEALSWRGRLILRLLTDCLGTMSSSLSGFCLPQACGD